MIPLRRPSYEVVIRSTLRQSHAGIIIIETRRSSTMTDTVDNLILDLLEWVGRKERTYQETMEAWRTSCPKLPVWEDANDRRLVEVRSVDGRSVICIASVGMDLLKAKRPHSYEELQHQGGQESQPIDTHLRF